MKIPVSVVVLTKNESEGIADTLSHLTDYVEIIVVDSGSEDNTVEIAQQHGARVVQFTWNQKYPKKKQWSLDNCGCISDWILLLDADEYPTDELNDEIERLFAKGPDQGVSAYDISLYYRFAGKFLKHGHRVVKRSLINRHRVSFPEVNDLGAPGIREVEGHYQPQTKDKVAKLLGRLCHDDQDPVRSWFDRHNRYSDWEAYLRVNSSLRTEIAGNRTWRGSLFDKVPLKPIAFFTYGYLIKRGFLDGRPGLDYAIALSMYYWQTGVKTRELARSTPRDKQYLQTLV